MFNRKNDESPITRTEAETALAAYVTREDAQQYADALSALDSRVNALENLARELRNSPVRTAPAVRVATQEAPRVTTPATGVDYGAIAFGLSEIKREVKSQFGVTDAQMATKWRGTVQYFADVFAKADSSFDARLFTSQAGV